ncbi:hypothetical protein B0A55_00137 [Friedmanniomyces simplex]|uniref:Amino acid permease/ SLC12A domain-containing protein n=1 Tax=Friedmanniomyces simplex TaxID=329884 RepID=A0A4U0Y0G4_9PEZI|nr:hypothetical protein B0A55_00137 [Friedmanniomyces simplex]
MPAPPPSTIAGHGPAIELIPQGEMSLRRSMETTTAKGFLSNATDFSSGVSFEDPQDEDLRATKSTRGNAAGMRRLGKDQQLVRNFRQLSIISFVAIAKAAWEIGLFVVTPGLVDGSRSGLVYNTIWNLIGFGPVYLSMAEMASMAPIAGAQFSEFAPESCQRFLSYLTGLTSTMAWQSANAMGIFLVGSLIQTMILVNDENYAFPSWQGTFLAFAAMGIAYMGNVYGSRVLQRWQNAVCAIHILGYFGYIIPIWINAPRATHQQVWADWQNEGGWGSLGLAVLVGQLSGISQQTGIDTAAHMSEEVKDAASSIPRTMIAVYLINMALILPAIITIVYHIPDLDAALNGTMTYPALYVLRQSMSVGWVTVMLIFITFVNMASNIVYLDAATRDLFAFQGTREGLPFSKCLSTIHPTRQIPVNACILSCASALLLVLIYIGSMGVDALPPAQVPKHVDVCVQMAPEGQSLPPSRQG